MTDVARWIAALSTLAGLGLTLGLNPALYAATVDALAQNTRVATRVGGMIGGLFVGATALYLALQSFDPTALVAVAEERANDAVRDARVDAIAAAVFLLAALAILGWRVRQPVRAVKATASTPPRSRVWSSFVLGLGCSIIGFTTLPIMYMTGRVTDGVTGDPVLRIAAFAVFLVALALPFAGMAGLWSFFPDAGRRVSAVYARVSHADHRLLAAAVLAAAGVACLVLAVMPR